MSLPARIGRALRMLILLDALKVTFGVPCFAHPVATGLAAGILLSASYGVFE